MSLIQTLHRDFPLSQKHPSLYYMPNPTPVALVDPVPTRCPQGQGWHHLTPYPLTCCPLSERSASPPIFPKRLQVLSPCYTRKRDNKTSSPLQCWAIARHCSRMIIGSIRTNTLMWWSWVVVLCGSIHYTPIQFEVRNYEWFLKVKPFHCQVALQHSGELVRSEGLD